MASSVRVCGSKCTCTLCSEDTVEPLEPPAECTPGDRVFVAGFEPGTYYLTVHGQYGLIDIREEGTQYQQSKIFRDSSGRRDSSDGRDRRDSIVTAETVVTLENQLSLT